MNEEALTDAHGLFAETGYNGSVDDFKTLISTNKEALNDAFKLFSDTGYNGSTEDFSALVGISKPTSKKNKPKKEKDSWEPTREADYYEYLPLMHNEREAYEKWKHQQ